MRSFHRKIVQKFKRNGMFIDFRFLQINCFKFILLEQKNKFLFQENEFETIYLQKPEIYKHPVAFKFLNNFSMKAPHLIFRRPEYIRILKNAFNILILPIPICKNGKIHDNDKPFMNYKRMLNLAQEVWTNKAENIKLLEDLDIKPIRYFEKEKEVLKRIVELT